MVKRTVVSIFFALLVALLLCFPAHAAAQQEAQAFDMREQLDALGKDELMQQIPEGAQELLEETGVGDIAVDNLLQLSPRAFFKALWDMLLGQLRAPVTVLGTVLGIVVLCTMLGGLRNAGGENGLSPVFATVCVLCVLTAIAVPILDCVVETAKAIQQASTFMLSFIPMFSAALVASGRPVTGATYNLFLFSTCQIVSQVVSRTLIPLVGIYLAVCIASTLTPGISISSAGDAVKSAVNWALGLILTIFVGLLSVQSIVAQSADTVTTRTARFLISSGVPAVGKILSEAYTAAQGCLHLLKSTLGAYGILVAAFTFLPILIQTACWHLIANAASIVGDILGAGQVSRVLKACANALGILVAMIFCYALLIIVSTTVVLVTGLGAG